MRISDWSSDVCSSDLPQLPAVDHVLGVGEELRPGGEDPRPVGPLLVAEAVDQRRDVDGDAGVAVGPPRAAGAVPLLEDHVVVDAGPLELYRGPDPAEAGPDDPDVVVRVRCGPSRRGGVSDGYWGLPGRHRVEHLNSTLSIVFESSSR